MIGRRQFLKILALAISGLKIGTKSHAMKVKTRKKVVDPKSIIYRSINGSPDQNLIKVIEMFGGIGKIIGGNDVVVIKPNVQWWNQGVPNLAAMKTFIDLIFERTGGFEGEVVVAENCHRGPEPWKQAGWAYEFLRNSNLKEIKNFNDLLENLKEKYGEKFSTCHWIDVDSGGKRVFSPADGPGYVYCDGSGGVPLISFNNGAEGSKYREVIMTYPIFKTDMGTIVDFKHGVWRKGKYSDQPLKFINFAALNHHSIYCGITSTIKNYLGVTDLSGGADPSQNGKLTPKYYNFHSFPFDKWAAGPVTGMIGAEIGVFMKTIRKADLNIISAEWVGLSSRFDEPVVRPRAILASEDPTALDYHAVKYILYPNSQIKFHNPDDPQRPTYQYLKACAEHGGGIFDESKVAVKSWDFIGGRLQQDDELVILSEKEWGSKPKAILKYLVLRYGSFLL